MTLQIQGCEQTIEKKSVSFGMKKEGTATHSQKMVKNVNVRFEAHRFQVEEGSPALAKQELAAG